MPTRRAAFPKLPNDVAARLLPGPPDNRVLVDLGYATKDNLDPASDHFGWQTYYGLRRMQKAVGVEVTGDLPLGQALFLPPTQLRITSVAGTLGGKAADRPHRTDLPRCAVVHRSRGAGGPDEPGPPALDPAR